MALFDHFGLLAPVYDYFIGPPDPGPMIDLLQLPAPVVLLDAGGGTGRASAGLRPLVNHVVIGDISRPMLQKAQRKGPFRPMQTDIHHLPFATNSLDRIMVVDALHHFPNQTAALAELARILKPGGIMVIEEPDIDALAVKFIAIAERLALMGSNFLNPKKIQTMIEGHGLRARIEHDNEYIAWVVATK